MTLTQEQARRFVWEPGDLDEVAPSATGSDEDEVLAEQALVEAEERKVGDVWQGPSGKWFTKNKDNRTVPAKDPGKKEGAPAAKKEPAKKEEKQKPEKAPKASVDQVHAAIQRATESGQAGGKEYGVALGKALGALTAPQVKELRAKLGMTKGIGAKQKLADELVAKVQASAPPKAEPKPPEKPPGPKEEEKPPAPAPAAKKPGIPPPQPVVRRPEPPAAKAEPKPPAPPAKPPEPAPVPEPAAASAGVPKADPFPPGSGRAGALAALSKALADPDVSPADAARAALGPLNDNGREQFIKGMGIPVGPGQSHVQAVAAFVQRQRTAPAAPEQGFTGTDALGRKWENGKLVAKEEEPKAQRPAAAPEPPPAPKPPAPAENPFPPGSTRSKAWAELGRGAKDLSLDPKRAAEKALANLSDQGRDQFLAGMGITRTPGQSHADALAAHVAAQRNADLPADHVVRKIAESPHLKAKLDALAKLDPDAAHERRKQKFGRDAKALEAEIAAGTIHPDDAAAQLASLTAEADAIRDADRDEKARRASAVREALLLPPERQAGMKAGRVGPMSENNVRAVKDGLGWLDGIVAKGAGGEDFPPVDFGEDEADPRPFYRPSEHRVNMGKSQSASVAIHETGHAVETRMPGCLGAALQFVEHRCRGEKPIKMADKYGDAYAAGETGRKDHFDRALDEHHAYYVGKDYGGAGSEVLSMGLEALYDDPEGFARKDPEYCAFVVGILDGSLRKNPREEKLEFED